LPRDFQFNPEHDFRSRSRGSDVCMTREDAQAFSQGLREALPRLRFVSDEYWKPFIDWDAWRATLEEHRRRDQAGLPTERARYRMRDPVGEPLHYWDSLCVAEEGHFYGWIEPPGWEPAWGEEDDYGVRRILNPPPLQFHFRRSKFRCYGRDVGVDQIAFDDPPEARSEAELIRLDGGTLDFRWNRYDEEARAFTNRLFRILSKQGTNRFINIDLDSRRALSLTPLRNRFGIVAGHHAERWALSRRHNYIFPSSGLVVKPASYRFATGDVMSAEELVALKAKWKAELEARVVEAKRYAAEVVARNNPKN